MRIEAGESTIEEEAAEIANMYENRLNFVPDIDFSFEKGKENLIPVVVNTEVSKELFLEKNILHRDIMDLSIVLRYKADGGSILVSKDFLQHINMTEDEAFEFATKNALQESYSIKNIQDILIEMIGADSFPEELPEPELPMIVVTNKEKLNGAVGLFVNEELRKAVHDKIGDFFIIPSSIHECIVVPASEDSSDAIKSIISEVNATQVSPEDKLSDTLYEVGADLKIRYAGEREKDNLADSLTDSSKQAALL